MIFLRRVVEKKAIQTIRQGTVLDLGCGDGIGLSRFASRNDWQSVGLDPRITPMRKAKRYGMCVRGVGEDLPFNDDAFNLVIASQVLHHVSDLRRVLREIFRSLQKGMLLVVEETTEDNPIHRILRLFIKSFQGYPVKNKFYRRELRDLLRQTGFTLLIEQKSQILVWIWLELARKAVVLRNVIESLIKVMNPIEEFLQKRLNRFCLECYILAQKKGG